MRFLPNGPNIPDRLLEVRDAGRVVFLCGAGVSIPAGMPSFVRLTRDVLTHLRTPADSPIYHQFMPWEDPETPINSRVPLDQIFHAIREVYGRDRVNAVVAELLGASDTTPESREHSIVARLSADPDGNPQIVTTNFDLLFEHTSVSPDIQIFEPPVFPELRYDQAISGITYLHGRLQSDQRRPHDYVLSSADFGRAYLAEAWATRFIRLLLERYTVVLLGYQADDPPVRYLLQGLNSTSSVDARRLYAFDRGTSEEVEAKWRDRGVTPIAYPGDGHDHSLLWDSLEAWASRADGPTAWRSGIIEMARRGPRGLQPHERGQVAHVLRTNLGAKAFADAEPSPPAEWLCVFDVGRRLADIATPLGNEEEFSPRQNYALDDDPEPSINEEQGRGLTGDDLIAWRPGDGRPTSEFRLSGGATRGFEALPPRLFHLCRWIVNNASDPVVAWWAARQHRLHPRLVSMISSWLYGEDDIPDTARRAWNLILECLEKNKEDVLDRNMFATRRRLAREGWTSSVLRSLEQRTEPFVKVDAGLGRRQVEPPIGGWSDIALNDIARFSIEFPIQRGSALNIPDDSVTTVFLLASRNLIRGLERLEEVGSGWFHTFTLYPDDAGPGRRFRSANAEYLIWFADIMRRAAQQAPASVSATILLWPTAERSILNKLRLFAWSFSGVYDGDQVAENLRAMEDDGFWNSRDRREFLYLVRDRWNDIPSDAKTLLLERLLAGRQADADEDTSEYSERRNYEVLVRLRWLEEQGCVFADDASRRIAEVQQRLPEWNDEWAREAARSLEGVSGGVETVRDPSPLDGVPISRIVETALEHTRSPIGELREYRPFDGLVREQPQRALAALAFEARGGNYPEEYWGTIVREWPDGVRPRARMLFCERLKRLPIEVIVANVHTVFSWIRDKLPAIAADNEPFALAVWDDLVDRLMAGGAPATVSAMGQARIGGRVLERSRRTFDHATNAPVGHAMEALIAILSARNLSQGHGMPDEFAMRIERLLVAPGEGSDHAVCVLTQQLSWLDQIAPGWVDQRIIPWFHNDHTASEPAWNGLFYGGQIVGAGLFAKIAAPFLDLFPRIYEWHWERDENRAAHEWLTMTTIWYRSEPRYTSIDAAASAMRRLSEVGRSDVIFHLSQVGRSNENGWTDLVIPFLLNTWPTETRFQTMGASAAFLSMLEDSNGDFPELLGIVRGFMRPIRQGHHSLYRFHAAGAGDEEPITERFPEEVLDLMDLIVADDPREAPYDLGEVLTLISETRLELTNDRRYIRMEELLAAR